MKNLDITTHLPLVTIITPTFNRANFLDETIQSVLQQDYPNIEYIILDDGSTDNTREILQKYMGRVYWETHLNMGETLTVNKGISLAKGEIICVVNSDDPLLPEAVSTAVKYLQQNDRALAAYPDWLEIDVNSVPMQEHKLPDYNVWKMLSEFNVSIGPGTFIRKSAFEIVGMRDPGVKYIGDLEYWFRIAGMNGLLHIPHTLATHRTHSSSASSSAKGSQMANEVAMIIKKLYEKKAIPQWAIGLKSYSMSIAHHDAVFYSGTNIIQALKHRLISFLYNPIVYIYRCATGFETPLRHKLYLLAWRILRKIGFKNPHELIEKNILLKTNLSDTLPKFGFVSHVLPPSWSGQAVVIERLLNHLDPANYCLISSHDYKDQTAEENNRRLPANYHVLPHEGKTFSNSRFGFLRLLSGLYRIIIRGINIAKIARAEKCDLLFAGTGDLIDIPATFLASFLTGTNFVPYLFDDYTYQWTNPFDRFLAKWFEKIIFIKAAKIIVPNEFLRDEIIKRHHIVPTIIRNPGEGISSIQKGNHDTNNNHEINLVYTGAIYHVNFKAIRNVISALNTIGSSQIKLHLYTAQPVSWLESEGIGGPYIVYHQHVPPGEVAIAQSKASILLIPFSFNSTVPEIIRTSAPGKLGDYLASGTPILAHVPPDSFVKWYINKYQCGVVVDEDNPDLIVDAIYQISKNLQGTKIIQNNALHRAELDFHPRTAKKSFENLLEFLR